MGIGDEHYSEDQAFTDLLHWSESRPVWQQDALRRILTYGFLSAEDIRELVEICLDDKSPKAIAFSELDIVPKRTDADPITLLKISNAVGINALAADQSLEFSDKGLTIVYGDNGAGKSGYVRVLKSACRSRDGNTSVLRDIEDNTNAPQSAHITFLRGSSKQTFEWSPGADTHNDLPSVSIFDSRSANIHVEETNAVAYIPRPMKVLEELAATCDKVKSELNHQIETLEEQTPESLRNPVFFSDTSASDFVQNLSAKSSISTLDTLIDLSDAEKKQVVDLEHDLTQDSKSAVARIESMLARIRDLRAKIESTISNSRDSVFAKRDMLDAMWQQKRDAVALASESLFKNAPLPNIGTEIWHALWEAARKYSEQEAYVGRPFPSDLSVDDLCVLCQQPLTETGVRRFQTFESFVTGTLKAEERDAETAARTHLEVAEQYVLPSEILSIHNLLAHELTETSLAKDVRTTAIVSSWRVRALLRGNVAPIPEIDAPRLPLDALESRLQRRVDALRADEESTERQNLLKTCHDLRDRTRLQVLRADIVGQIGRLKQIERHRSAEKSCAKRAVTNKNKELSDRIVSDALRGRFRREVDKLNVTTMPVELRKIRDKDAISYFRVCLVEQPSSSVAEIFSEGEHRCIALAAFLAELVTSNRYSSIVFDDPMSSLDHIHRKAVAARLIEEAKHRQVVIFTHDLAFLYEIRREANATDCPIAYQTVRKISEKPGYVAHELPNKAKSAKQLISALRSNLKNNKQAFQHWPETQRTVWSKGMIEQLRELWDQGIADFIFPVLERFDNKIAGSSLFRLVVLTENDVKIVTEARSRLSEDLHVNAKALNPAQVTPDDLSAEIGKLHDWLEDISNRQKAAKKPSVSFS